MRSNRSEARPDYWPEPQRSVPASEPCRLEWSATAAPPLWPNGRVPGAWAFAQDGLTWSAAADGATREEAMEVFGEALRHCDQAPRDGSPERAAQALLYALPADAPLGRRIVVSAAGSADGAVAVSAGVR